jgi:hypothetical protein
LPLRGADTDTDIKLREALEKKLNELQTQPPAAAPQSSVTAPKPKTPPAPATAPTSQDSEASAKAREASRPKMTELPTQPGGRPKPPGQWTPPPVVRPAPTVAQAPTPAPVVQPVHPTQVAANQPAVQPPPAVAQPTSTVSPVMDQKSIDKARETLHQQMTELENQPPAATAALIPSPKMADSQPGQKPVEAKAQETVGKPQVQPKAEKALIKPAKGAPALTPIQAPPPAISADKGARLAELLRKYKADEITPEEYHKQRTKILSEP